MDEKSRFTHGRKKYDDEEYGNFEDPYNQKSIDEIHDKECLVNSFVIVEDPSSPSLVVNTQETNALE